jgi:hypothetical protein
MIAAASAITVGATGAGLAFGTGGDDGAGQPISGGALNRASAAALDATGGGRVTGTEFRDEEGYYEVEVTRDDGSQVDVHLDHNFNVSDQSGDGSGSGGDDAGADEGSPGD